MASSGVKPDAAAIEKFEKLKLRKTYGYLLLKFKDNQIVVYKEGKPKSSVDDFVKAISAEKDCCFGVFDGNRIGLFAWNPDEAGAKAKMLLASSADGVSTAFGGLSYMTVSDSGELKDKMKEKNII